MRVILRRLLRAVNLALTSQSSGQEGQEVARYGMPAPAACAGTDISTVALTDTMRELHKRHDGESKTYQDRARDRISNQSAERMLGIHPEQTSANCHIATMSVPLYTRRQHVHGEPTTQQLTLLAGP